MKIKIIKKLIKRNVVKIKKNKTTTIAVIFCFVYALAFSLISIHRFWQFDVFYYDFGIFDTALWKVAHFQAPIIEHFRLGGKWIFADHFNPSIFFLSPLYWFTDKSEVMLVAQSVIVAISGSIIYFIGKKVTKNTIFSLGVMVSYLLFISVQNALITYFHEATISTLPLVLAIYFFITKKYKWYFLSFLIFLGGKESNFAVGISLAIGILLLDFKHNRKLSIGTALISLIWGLVAIKLIIPFFSGGEYLYSVSLPTNPITFLGSYINNPQKVNTLLISGLSFGFLPLLSFQFLPAVFIDFATRFYPSFLSLSWGVTFHYGAMTGAVLAISSVFSHSFLRKFLSVKVITFYGIGLILLSFFLHRFVTHGPLGLAYNQAFYQHSKDFAFLTDMVNLVPAGASIMTQNNIASHFTHEKVTLLRDKCEPCTSEHYRSIMPDYIVIDVRDGQGPNNYFGVTELSVILKSLQADGEYEAIYHKGDQYIFKKR